MTPPVLAIRDLTVAYRHDGRWLDAVRDLELTVRPGQTYGIVGESGSGKSTLVLAIMRYLAPNARVRSGSIELNGRDLLAARGEALERVWRDDLRLVPQDPLSALNPSLRVGQQLAETLPGGLDRREQQAQVLALLSRVRLADPQRIAASYPHQLSGGMTQRVLIAMALSGAPSLLLLDEPTTNLDATTEATILDLIEELVHAGRTAVLYVSHNLGVVARLCERVAVLYAGELVEDAPVRELFAKPLHPYTQGLLDSVPRLGQRKWQSPLRAIAGQLPPLDALTAGCVFAPRCPLATELTHRERPPLEAPSATRRVRCHRWREIALDEVSAHQPLSAPQSAPTLVPAPAGVVLDVRDLSKSFDVG
ncbi:MAG TPA: ABC transporter ATP-binding protein, partial [Chloroflexota bacterium]|nr:ABC transporter ATP-binding protein [Chloroflexota bacterium]